MSQNDHCNLQAEKKNQVTDPSPRFRKPGFPSVKAIPTGRICTPSWRGSLRHCGVAFIGNVIVLNGVSCIILINEAPEYNEISEVWASWPSPCTPCRALCGHSPFRVPLEFKACRKYLAPSVRRNFTFFSKYLTATLFVNSPYHGYKAGLINMQAGK